jgi:hypothetical protein
VGLWSVYVYTSVRVLYPWQVFMWVLICFQAKDPWAWGCWISRKGDVASSWDGGDTDARKQLIKGWTRSMLSESFQITESKELKQFPYYEVNVCSGRNLYESISNKSLFLMSVVKAAFRTVAFIVTALYCLIR